MDNKDNSYSKVNKVTKGKTTISKIQNDIIENKINELNIKCENIAKENEEIKKLIQTKVIDLSKIYHNFSKININKGKDKKNNTKAYTNVQTEVNQEKEYKKDIDLLRLDTLELLSSCDKNQIHKLIYYQPKVKYSHKLRRRNRIVPKLNLVRYIINI